MVKSFFVRIKNSEAFRHELPGLGNSSGLESYIVQSLKGATGFLFLMDNGTLDEKKNGKGMVQLFVIQGVIGKSPQRRPKCASILVCGLQTRRHQLS